MCYSDANIILLTLMQYFSSIIFFKISLMPIYWLLWHLKIHDILPKITEIRDVILTNWFIFNLKTNNLIICSLFRRLGNKLFLSVPFKVYFRNIGFTFDGTQRGAGIILTRLLQTDVCFVVVLAVLSYLFIFPNLGRNSSYIR